MNLKDVHKYIKGMKLCGCGIHRKDHYLFLAIALGDLDPLEQKEAGVFVARIPEGRKTFEWAYRGLGEGTGVTLCKTSVPKEQWIFVFDDGAVRVIGGGEERAEDPVSDPRSTNITDLRRMPSGNLIASGTSREIFSRIGPDAWSTTVVGPITAPTAEDIRKLGFSSVDAFSETEIYACGGLGDLWQFDGREWLQRNIPTNDRLIRLLCASDGNVYVTMNSGHILYGRNEEWETIEQNLTDQHLESIADFQSRIYIGTHANLYEIDALNFQLAGIGSPAISAKRHLASGYDLLLVAGDQDAAVFDGTAWEIILPAP